MKTGADGDYDYLDYYLKADTSSGKHFSRSRCELDENVLSSSRDARYLLIGDKVCITAAPLDHRNHSLLGKELVVQSISLPFVVVKVLSEGPIYTHPAGEETYFYRILDTRRLFFELPAVAAQLRREYPAALSADELISWPLKDFLLVSGVCKGTDTRKSDGSFKACPCHVKGWGKSGFTVVGITVELRSREQGSAHKSAGRIPDRPQTLKPDEIDAVPLDPQYADFVAKNLCML